MGIGMRRVGAPRKGEGAVWTLVKLVCLLGLCSWFFSLGLTKTRDLVPQNSAAQLMREYDRRAELSPSRDVGEDEALDGDLVKRLSESIGSEEDSELWVRTHPRLVDHWKNRALHKFSIRNINHGAYNELRESGLSEEAAYFLSFAKYPEAPELFVSTQNVRSLKANQMPSKKAVENFLPRESPRLRFRTCAVVGNGAS